MPPRRSAAKNKHAQPVASSSKVTLDSIPQPDIPASLTPDFQPNQRAKTFLDLKDRQSLVHELIGFFPSGTLLKIEEDARHRIYDTVASVENWARGLAERQKGGIDIEREIDIGAFQMETILEAHIDRAFDKFTAWALRNAFDFPPELEIVMPWHQGTDFDRGEYVAGLPGGEDSLRETIDDLRTKVEQARLLSYRLALAERQMDRRLAIARQRKAEVGFVKEILSASKLSPLPPKAQQIVSSLEALHGHVASLEELPPSDTTIPPGTKAWEMGRQAYLTWAVGKMIHPEGKEDALETAEEMMQHGGGQEGLDRLSRAVGA